MILMSISMCKHFHRRYASKWFVWIGGTIYINIEKKMRVNLLPLSNSTFLKTSSSVLKESWYIFFINLSQLFARTQWQYTCMKPELMVQSKSDKKTCIFLDSFQMGYIKRNFKQYINMRWMHDQINRKEKAGIQKNYEWNKCTQRRRIK